MDIFSDLLSGLCEPTVVVSTDGASKVRTGYNNNFYSIEVLD